MVVNRYIIPVVSCISCIITHIELSYVYALMSFSFCNLNICFPFTEKTNSLHVLESFFGGEVCNIVTRNECCGSPGLATAWDTHMPYCSAGLSPCSSALVHFPLLLLRWQRVMAQVLELLSGRPVWSSSFWPQFGPAHLGCESVVEELTSSVLVTLPFT